MKTTKEVKDILRDTYQSHVEGTSFLRYCNGYGDGYIDALAMSKLINEKQYEELTEWNNREEERWYDRREEDKLNSMTIKMAGTGRNKAIEIDNNK